MSDSANLQMAIDQIVAARQYTKSLLENIDQNNWFRQPVEKINHVAWQVGHLAMAQLDQRVQYLILLFIAVATVF